MALSRFGKLTSSLLASGLLAASCAAPQLATQAPPPATKRGADPGKTVTGPLAKETVAERIARKVRPAPPALPPPPVITTPMKGEPTGAALTEARLVATTCDKASTEQIDLRLKEMRAAVDASFKEWHDGQPDCWAQDRQEAQMRREMNPGVGVMRAFKPAQFGSALSDGSGGPAPKSAYAPPAPPAPSAAPRGADEKSNASAPAAARSASGTNNQVASVDEADIVKTDGRYVYLAANGALRIVEALKPKMVSVTMLPGNARELFVDGDRAVVFTSNGANAKRCTYAYDCTFAGDGSSTSILVLDISNHATPKVLRQIDLSGSLVAARRIGNAVHTVVADNDSETPPYETWPEDLDMCGTKEAVVRAKFAKLKADNEPKIRKQTSAFPTMREHDKAQTMCNGLLRTAIRDGQAFTSVVSFDMHDDKTPATTATLQSRPGAVFASRDALYLSVVHQKQNGGGRWYSSYPSVDEASEIHKFHIGTSPKDTRYVGSGIVPGHVLNQFAMDEWSGYLRVATTRGRVPDPKVSSAVSIVAEGSGGNLVRVGAVENIAPGEDIRAVRFDDDRGYVVTFKKTDPLFVLDLYQPSRPKVLGELKIPGFSTYIHRLDPSHLLSIGFDANDHGDFAYFDGVILQLFDVKNPTDPRLIHKEKIGSRGSSSEAATDHLAFNYFSEQGLLAIPMTICDGGGDGRNGDQLSFSGLLVYDVDLEKGFTRLGGVDHGTKGADCNTWWSNATSAVKRSVFLDDLVYSIASDRVKVQRMGQLGEDLADLSLVP
ncbi:MAG: hypothetical protein JWP87_4734 [Labilithrix sp.]|nr:hypothetical protein [Labilithrix sp.]